ncbi:MAG: class I SAM-dependent methyltransferase [Solirubrobacterales bacterium]|nr:class I SAM-dependent methyltransferase [Solirubrobacterales bacterium]MBV9680503.1 class I SAM-dependent methyltransferase [Solirubrobacterales bacterium]
MDQRLMNAMLELDDRHWWYRGRRRIIRAELDRLPVRAGARVLDAGCGSGRTLEELGRYGEVSGIELDPGAAEMAQGRGCGEVRVGRLEELPWADGYFDLITCLDVIEHTPDDRATLSELRRVCKPGGFLVVTVPAYQGLWSTHDVANHHYRRYSRPRLREAALDAGWRVRRMTSFNGLLLAPAAAVRVAERRRLRQPNSDYKPELTLGPEWLNAVLEQPLRLEARWLGRGRTMPAGLSLLAVFENPGAAG